MVLCQDIMGVYIHKNSPWFLSNIIVRGYDKLFYDNKFEKFEQFCQFLQNYTISDTKELNTSNSPIIFFKAFFISYNLLNNRTIINNLFREKNLIPVALLVNYMNVQERSCSLFVEIFLEIERNTVFRLFSVDNIIWISKYGKEWNKS